jgi:DNA-binding transcriptional MerR regulator
MYATEDLISAKQITEKLGLSYQTINNYTDLGLLQVVTRKNRQRMYNYRIVAKRVAAIKRCIREGYTLRLISKQLGKV